jgi:hypothetical protein
MVHIRQSEFKKLIGQDTRNVRESKERMVRETGPDAHRPRVKDPFVCQRRKRLVAMHNVYLFPNENVPHDGKEGVDGWEDNLVGDDPGWEMVHF